MKMKAWVRTRSAALGLNFTVRDLNEILKGGYQQVGEMWHREMRPTRFTKRGARELNFPKRQGEQGGAQAKGGFQKSYTGRKLREKGHTKPNVWSGASELLSKARTVRATSKGVRVSLPGLRDWNRRKPKGWSGPLSEQWVIPGTKIGRITERERVQMVRTVRRYVDSKLRAFRRSKTITIT